MNLLQIHVGSSDVQRTGILPRACSSTRILPVKLMGMTPSAGLSKRVCIQAQQNQRLSRPPVHNSL